MQILKLKKYLILLKFLLLIGAHGQAQSGSIRGIVSDAQGVVEGATVSIAKLQTGTITNEKGEYHLKDLIEGHYIIKISFIGYKSIEETIEIKKGVQLERNFTLQDDALNLSQVVVTGTRSEVSRYNSPVIINTISNKTFEATQSLHIAEGLNFSPRLRI